jgi:hypothetical protein
MSLKMHKEPCNYKIEFVEKPFNGACPGMLLSGVILSEAKDLIIVEWRDSSPQNLGSE